MARSLTSLGTCLFFLFQVFVDDSFFLVCRDLFPCYSVSHTVVGLKDKIAVLSINSERGISHSLLVNFSCSSLFVVYSQGVDQR
jgi:hypothetical protein